MSGVRRVVVVTPSMDGADGVGEVCRQAVAALVAVNGPDAVEVWALEGARPAELPAGVVFESAGGSRRRFSVAAIARAFRGGRDTRVLALHLHVAPVALPLVYRGASLAVFLHGIEAWVPIRPRERAALSRATLVANSQWTADRFREVNPAFAATPITVCHLGIGAAPEPVMPDETGFALIVGRLASGERYKGHDQLIAAWPAVRDAVPGARLVAAGDGDDRPRLEREVRVHGLGDSIRFAGRVPAAELEGLYRASALFAMPSTREGFGLAYLEAMRASRAVIACPGAASEIVEEGRTGLLVPQDAQAIATALITLFRDPRRCATMGQAGYTRLGEHFEARHFADRLIGAIAPAGAGAEAAHGMAR